MVAHKFKPKKKTKMITIIIYEMSVYLTVQLISTIDPGPKYLSLSLLPYTLVSELETTTTHSDGTATVATLLHLILVLGEILSSHTAELVIFLLTPGTAAP